MPAKKKGFTVLNKNGLITSILLLIFFKMAFPVQDKMAYLNISSTPQGLQVYLDNRLIGQTPLHHHAIEPGNHHITVYSPYWPAWNISNYEKNLIAYGDKTYDVKASFEKMVYINSLPYDADVVINNKSVGKTPIYLKSDTLKTITLEKKGYSPQTIRVDSLQNMAVINMTPNAEYIQQQWEKTRSQASRIKQKKRLFWGSLAFTAVAGLSTIHFRSRGNQEYDRYQNTIIPDKMNQHFDNARLYDRLAGISYALFETGFVLSGYFFLSSRQQE